MQWLYVHPETPRGAHLSAPGWLLPLGILQISAKRKKCENRILHLAAFTYEWRVLLWSSVHQNSSIHWYGYVNIYIRAWSQPYSVAIECDTPSRSVSVGWRKWRGYQEVLNRSTSYFSAHTETDAMIDRDVLGTKSGCLYDYYKLEQHKNIIKV